MFVFSINIFNCRQAVVGNLPLRQVIWHHTVDPQSYIIPMQSWPQHKRQVPESPDHNSNLHGTVPLSTCCTLTATRIPYDIAHPCLVPVRRRLILPRARHAMSRSRHSLIKVITYVIHRHHENERRTWVRPAGGGKANKPHE